MVQRSIITIFHVFDWYPQPCIKIDDIDMMEAFITTCPLVGLLIIIAKPHLPPQVYKKLI